MINPQFFEMSYDDNSLGGIADAPDEFYYNPELIIYELNFLPFSFELDNNIFEDYIMNNLSFPLMSSRLKQIFDKFKNTAPVFKWFNTKVQSKNKNHYFEYFLMAFATKPDVLDFDKTRFIDNDYIYGFFSYKKIKSYSFFPQPRDLDGTLVVSEEIKNEIVKTNITGVSFTKADITFEI